MKYLESKNMYAMVTVTPSGEGTWAGCELNAYCPNNFFQALQMSFRTVAYAETEPQA